MGEGKLLQVVLLNWNNEEQTAECLRRIAQWRDLSLEIHVVDNGSTDGSAERIAADFPDVFLHANPENLGYAGGSNTALRLLLSETGDSSASVAVLLLNTDAFINEEDLGTLLRNLGQDPTIGVIGPVVFSGAARDQLLSAGGRDPVRHSRTYWNDAQGHVQAHGNTPYDVDYVSGTVALLRIDVLQGVGLFDEEYFFSCEMADLCARIKQAGYRSVIDPKARAWHDMAQSGHLRQTLYLYYSLRNRFLLIRKFRGNDRILRVRWTFVALYGAMKALLRGNPGSARAHVLACRHGLQGRFGKQNHLFLRSSAP